MRVSASGAFQTLPGASFVVNGATPATNSALTSAGAELRLANGVSLLAKFDGEFATHSSTYAGTGAIRHTWLTILRARFSCIIERVGADSPSDE